MNNNQCKETIWQEVKPLALNHSLQNNESFIGETNSWQEVPDPNGYLDIILVGKEWINQKGSPQLNFKNTNRYWLIPYEFNDLTWMLKNEHFPMKLKITKTDQRESGWKLEVQEDYTGCFK